jgi:hypothetical protein
MSNDEPELPEKEMDRSLPESAGQESGKGLDPVNPQQTNMEVFHYPNMHHKKKHFTQYFLEFLMIFLAVTMGFFAESIRQYISDKEHVHRLCGQLVHDLRNDSAILDFNITKENLLVKKSDSLFEVLQQPLAKLDSKRLQELLFACYNINLFQPSSGAMLAIKTELHLKQFANSNMTLFISNYETDQALLKTIEQFQMANLKEYVQGFITAHFTAINAYSSLTNGFVTNAQCRNLTPNDLTQLSVEIMFIKNYNGELADKSSQLKEKAAEFIRFVVKEFDPN